MNTAATTKQSPVTLTESALIELKRLMVEKNIPEDHALRVGVKGGGCAGFSYILGFDKKEPLDEEFEFGGLKIFMNKAHQMYLAGIEIDYKDGLDARGFVFNNPNATKTCGCGSSFSA
ncbi:MAG TPA: iron-sulfur cluster assembly accessory protein [Chitinophagales bacterium]|nr:iron-sulfur cluster assembly accessory protein [Chitinophagales bacterium]